MALLDALAASTGLATGLAFVFGLLWGSFLNVVILRVPPRLEWQWRRDCRELLELPQPDPAVEPEPPAWWCAARTAPPAATGSQPGRTSRC